MMTCTVIFHRAAGARRASHLHVRVVLSGVEHFDANQDYARCGAKSWPLTTTVDERSRMDKEAFQ
jgi:hypothetical protein